MQGDAKGKSGRSLGPGLGKPEKSTGDGPARGPESRAMPPEHDDIARLLKTLFRGIADEPLPAELQDLAERLLSNQSKDDQDHQPDHGEEAPTS